MDNSESRPLNRVQVPNAQNNRNRPTIGGIPRVSMQPLIFQQSFGTRLFEPFCQENLPELAQRRIIESYMQAASCQLNRQLPLIICFPPVPPQPDPVVEFHSVHVFSGPFPILHTPGQGPIRDIPLMLGPYPLHNIPLIPGSVPVHHIPYIPGPENVPHIPVLYEPNAIDPDLTFPGYSILVPVPRGAIPAVQMYIIPSDFMDGPNHVLIFQHGYTLPRRERIVYINPSNNHGGAGGGGVRNTRESRFRQVPHSEAQRERERSERRVRHVYPPPLGLRIGRQPQAQNARPAPPNTPRGRNRMPSNTIVGNVEFGQSMVFRYPGQLPRSYRSVSRRSSVWHTGRGQPIERYRYMQRTLHSCGSNDPNHNCLEDQRHPRRIPSVTRWGNAAGRRLQLTAVSEPPQYNGNKRGGADKNTPRGVDKKLRGDVDKKTLGSVDKKTLSGVDKKTPSGVDKKTPSGADKNIPGGSDKKKTNHPDKVTNSPEKNTSTDVKIQARTEIEQQNVLAASSSSASQASTSKMSTKDTASATKDSTSSSDDSSSEDNACKKKTDAIKKSNQDGPEEAATASSSNRRPRYRPTYNWLRNPKRNNNPGAEKMKIRNYDEHGNRVPTYRQAAHYCTKYHEKEARKKLRKQIRSGMVITDTLGKRTLLDDWLGDGTTTESDSDSSFLTDEGGDERKPANFNQMIEYYYEIKALKEEQKKKKKK